MLFVDYLRAAIAADFGVRAIHVPGEMIERLIVRMVERRGFDQGRIEALRKMIRNYKHRLFSARARLRLLNDLENQLHSEALR